MFPGPNLEVVRLVNLLGVPFWQEKKHTRPLPQVRRIRKKPEVGHLCYLSVVPFPYLFAYQESVTTPNLTPQEPRHSHALQQLNYLP